MSALGVAARPATASDSAFAPASSLPLAWQTGCEGRALLWAGFPVAVGRPGS